MSRRGDRTGDGVERAELARLDRDLREILIDERCSFGAELRAELLEEHRRLQSRRASRMFRIPVARLAAAAVVLLLAGTLAVPGARAALAKLLDSSSQPSTVTLDPAPEAPPPIVERRPATMASAAETPSPRPLPATLPALLDRDMARRIVAREYPAFLQRAGIGGTVQVLMWVRPDGVADRPQVGGSSGVSQLDAAALRATRSLRFLPATRSGQAVGTWVEFSIKFEPNGTEPQPHPQYQAFQIPLSN